MKKYNLFKALIIVCAICAVSRPLAPASVTSSLRPSYCRAAAQAASNPQLLYCSAAAPVISWGLKHNGQERTPIPPEGSVKLLKENNGLFVGNTEGKKVYFTFDLGYEAGFTAKTLDILKENNIKGIFFLCGNYLREEELINRMIAEGHEIGNHTDRHKDLPALSAEAAQKDIVDFREKFKSRYPQTSIRFFRPPHGRFSETTLKTASAEGLKTALWSIAIADWGKAPIDAAASAAKITQRLHPGAIILLHITNSGAPETLKLLIPMMAAKGYAAGVPSEL